MSRALEKSYRQYHKFRVRYVARALAGATTEEAWAALPCNERRAWLRMATTAVEAYEATR